MANYVPANLVKAQAMLLGKFQTSELRFRQPATFLEFVRQSSIMFPNYEELRTREDRVVETNYKARTSRSLGTGGRTFNHTGVKGDSLETIKNFPELTQLIEKQYKFEKTIEHFHLYRIKS